MEKVLDFRGIADPQPALLMRRALGQMDQGRLVAVVDNPAAVENMVKVIKDLDCEVDIKESGDDYYIHIEKSTAAQPALDEYYRTVLLVSSRFLGRGDDELGRKLMSSFFYTLAQTGQHMGAIIFMNGGVALTSQGSEALDHILTLEQAGVEIINSATCLEHYGLRNQLMVGKVCNMYSIAEKLMTAAKVITI